MLYPNKKVSVGDTWKQTFQQSSLYLGNLVSEYECELEKITQDEGRKVAVIRYTGSTRKAEKTGPRARLFFSLMDLKSSDVEGTAVYDIELSRFVRQTEQVTTEVVGQMDGPQLSGLHLA